MERLFGDTVVFELSPPCCSPPLNSKSIQRLHTFRPEQHGVARFVAVWLSVMLQQKKEDFPRYSSRPELVPSISIKSAYVSLTSAWLPGARVLLHLSQRRQGRCQFFPRDDTFSAAHIHTHTHTTVETVTMATSRLSHLEDIPALIFTQPWCQKKSRRCINKIQDRFLHIYLQKTAKLMRSDINKFQYMSEWWANDHILESGLCT